jgi:hypothetical protein
MDGRVNRWMEFFLFGIKLDESFLFPLSVAFYLGISLKTEVVYPTYT